MSDGVLAANWLLKEVEKLNPVVSPNVTLSVKLFKHPNWIQPSVIARLEAKNGDPNADLIITGTHFDTRGSMINLLTLS